MTPPPAAPSSVASRWFAVGWGLVVVGVVGEAFAYPALALGPAAAAAVGYLLVLAAAPRARWSAAWLLGMTLLVRVPGVVLGPVLSDDLHRYVWEGEVVRRGLDPYALGPNAAELAGLRAELPALHAALNHPDVSAAYPPLTQAVHAGLVALARIPGGDFVARAELLVRGFYLACDLGVFALLLGLAARRGRSAASAAAWGFCPLLAFEFGGSGHFDALAILLVVAAFAWTERATEDRAPAPPTARKRAAPLAPLGAGLALVAAVLVKFLPIVALAGWVRERRPSWAKLAVLALALGVGLAPLLASARGLAGLGEYASRWEAFNVVHRVVHGALERWRGSGADPLELAHDSRIACGVLWLVAVAVAWRRCRGDGLAFTRAAIGAFLVLTPVLHPWYLAWIVPFLALGAHPAWAWLVASGPFLYATLAGGRARGDWSEPAWLWPFVVVPLVLLAGFELARARRASRVRGESASSARP